MPTSSQNPMDRLQKYIRNVPEIEKYVIMPDHIRMTIRLDNGSMWASTPTRNKLIDLFRKKIFERIMRPHPCAQTLEKGCGLTYGTKTRKKEPQSLLGSEFFLGPTRKMEPV